MQNKKNIAIIGGGPAGLMAAEVLAGKGCSVTVYDHMPSLGRKFLMAGRGGLNLTHSEPLDIFLTRYGSAQKWLEPHIRAFTPQDLRNWCEGLGQETFVGSSGRVFPKVMKASPLLRAWLKRLDALGVKFALNHSWSGFEAGALKFTNGLIVKPNATLLALGGASWPKLGSNGSWVNILAENGVEVAPLKPANCGFTVNWSDYFKNKFAGTPLKSVMLTHGKNSHQGEVMITTNGIEGGGIYAISASLRNAIEKNGSTILKIDLRPGMTAEQIQQKLGARGKQSISTYLRKAGFAPITAALLREDGSGLELAEHLKNISITLTGTSGMARAISSAGGITQNAVDENLMLLALPNVFVCGEMLDWEAPTGGYLLQGCFSTAVAAAGKVANQLL